MKPAELNAAIKKYVETREARLALDKKSAVLKTEEDMLKGLVMREVQGRNTSLYEFKGFVAELKMRAEAEVLDWTALTKHIKDTGEFDLLQKRVTVTAVRERWEVGKEVPGIKQSQVPEIAIKRAK